jgi:hypothetical protein
LNECIYLEYTRRILKLAGSSPALVCGVSSLTARLTAGLLVSVTGHQLPKRTLRASPV